MYSKRLLFAVDKIVTDKLMGGKSSSPDNLNAHDEEKHTPMRDLYYVILSLSHSNLTFHLMFNITKRLHRHESSSS
jgi:hypothetical protein